MITHAFREKHDIQASVASEGFLTALATAIEANVAAERPRMHGVHVSNVAELRLVIERAQMHDGYRRDLRSIDLSRGNFPGFEFHSVTLEGANLSRALFIGSEFYHVNLDRTNVNGTDFSLTRLDDVSFQWSHTTTDEDEYRDAVSFAGAGLSNANMSHFGVFHDDDIALYRMGRQIRLNMNFNRTAFGHDITFRNANLGSASFDDCSFAYGADFFNSGFSDMDHDIISAVLQFEAEREHQNASAYDDEANAAYFARLSLAGFLKLWDRGCYTSARRVTKAHLQAFPDAYRWALKILSVVSTRVEGRFREDFNELLTEELRTEVVTAREAEAAKPEPMTFHDDYDSEDGDSSDDDDDDDSDEDDDEE